MDNQFYTEITEAFLSDLLYDGRFVNFLSVSVSVKLISLTKHRLLIK